MSMRTSELTGTGLGRRIDGYQPDAEMTGIRSSLHEHGLLVLSDFPRDAGTFERFARRFGTPDPVFPQAHRLPGSRIIRLQSNVPGHGANSGGGYWHADGSMHKQPTDVTLLLCAEAPASDGHTLFADMNACLRRLPDPLYRTVMGASGYYPCRDIAAREITAAQLMRTVTITEEEKQAKLAEMENLWHPLVRRHPTTGREALYLNEHWLRGVDGMSEQDSRRLLDELYRRATTTENVYQHSWTVGDLLVWDNALVMHKALPAASGCRKVTHRITTSGNARASLGPERSWR